jgi:predicted phosphodiesterase
VPYLILSDLHANREALEAVLRDASGRYDRILCLGDVVGYGADPNHAVDWVRANAAAVIRGNHDRICVDDDLFWPSAKCSASVSASATRPCPHDTYN